MRERVREGDLHLHKFWAQYAAKYALFFAKNATMKRKRGRGRRRERERETRRKGDSGEKLHC